MKSVVKFASTTEMEAARRLFPVSKPRLKSAYDDLTLLPEYQSRKFTFPSGQTCIRVLPQLAGSTGWMHGIQVLTHPNGQHVHPNSLSPKSKSVFETCYGWLRTHKPDLLFNRFNRGGYRLLPSKMAICWLLVEVNREMQAHLFVGSAYDGGTAEGSCGVAHQLFKVATELSQPGGHDAIHAEHGVQIIVVKSTPHGEKYPTYKMTRSHMAAPIDRYLQQMQDAERAALRPLNEVLRRVDVEEEWDLVAKVIGQELRDEIRDSTAKPQPTPSPKPQPVSRATDESSPVCAELPLADEELSETSADPWRW